MKDVIDAVRGGLRRQPRIKINKDSAYEWRELQDYVKIYSW